MVAWEGCWRRYYPVAAWFAAIGVFELLALAFYGGDIDWDQPYGWVYLAVVVVWPGGGGRRLAVVHLGVSLRSAGAEDGFQLLGHRPLQLVVGARGRVPVGAPAHEVGGVAEPVPWRWS